MDTRHQRPDLAGKSTGLPLHSRCRAKPTAPCHPHQAAPPQLSRLAGDRHPRVAFFSHPFQEEIFYGLSIWKGLFICGWKQRGCRVPGGDHPEPDSRTPLFPTCRHLRATIAHHQDVVAYQPEPSLVSPLLSDTSFHFVVPCGTRMAPWGRALARAPGVTFVLRFGDERTALALQGSARTRIACSARQALARGGSRRHRVHRTKRGKCCVHTGPFCNKPVAAPQPAQAQSNANVPRASTLGLVQACRCPQCVPLEICPPQK